MAKNKQNEVLVGAFIAGALGLFVLLLFLMGTLSALFKPVSEVRVVFSDIRGLKPGDPVMFLGSKVGSVKGVDLLLKRAEPAVDDLAALARKLAGSDLEAAIADVVEIAHGVRDGVAPLREALGGAIEEARSMLAENRADLRRIATNFAESSELARRLLEKIEPAGEQVGAALARVEKAAATLSSAIEVNRPGIDAIVEEARQALANAANITADVRRRPWRLLYKPSEKESGELDLYDAAWAYNLGAAELGRSLDRLSGALAPGPDGTHPPEMLQAAFRDVEESLRRHKDAEGAFWTRLKAIR